MTDGRDFVNYTGPTVTASSSSSVFKVDIKTCVSSNNYANISEKHTNEFMKKIMNKQRSIDKRRK